MNDLVELARTVATDALVMHGLQIGGPAGVLVHSVGLRLGRGRCLGILGESGSGKTLTLRSMMGLLPEGVDVLRGELRVASTGGDGELNPIDDPTTLCGNGLSMVFQDPLAALDPTMRVGSFIAEVLVHSGTASRRAAAEQVRSRLGEVGFSDRQRIADSFPHQLSNGQRQRVLLAVALASDPAVLLCDEATSALDVTTQAQIIDLLDELRRRRQLAIVFVTHDLAVARQLVDDVVVMYGGHVVEVGDIDSVLERPRHPYTKSLIDAYVYGGDASVGDAIEPPVAGDQGCPYRRRCGRAGDACAAPLAALDGAAVRVGSACVNDELARIPWESR